MQNTCKVLVIMQNLEQFAERQLNVGIWPWAESTPKSTSKSCLKMICLNNFQFVLSVLILMGCDESVAFKLSRGVRAQAVVPCWQPREEVEHTCRRNKSYMETFSHGFVEQLVRYGRFQEFSGKVQLCTQCTTYHLWLYFCRAIAQRQWHNHHCSGKKCMPGGCKLSERLLKLSNSSDWRGSLQCTTGTLLAEQYYSPRMTIWQDPCLNHAQTTIIVQFDL